MTKFTRQRLIVAYRLKVFSIRLSEPRRHGRTCCGHPRLVCRATDVDGRNKSGHDSTVAQRHCTPNNSCRGMESAGGGGFAVSAGFGLCTLRTGGGGRDASWPKGAVFGTPGLSA